MRKEIIRVSLRNSSQSVDSLMVLWQRCQNIRMLPPGQYTAPSAMQLLRCHRAPMCSPSIHVFPSDRMNSCVNNLQLRCVFSLSCARRAAMVGRLGLSSCASEMTMLVILPCPLHRITATSQLLVNCHNQLPQELQILLSMHSDTRELVVIPIDIHLALVPWQRSQCSVGAALGASKRVSELTTIVPKPREKKYAFAKFIRVGQAGQIGQAP